MSSYPITVISTTYNSANSIGSLLKSLQDDSNLGLIDKVIIIENNSNEKILTKEVVIQKTNRSKIPIYFKDTNTNLGFAKSSNIGASYAKSEYLLFLNPDTTLQKNSLRILYEHAIQNSADIVGGLSEKKRNIFHKTVVRYPTLAIGLLEFSNLGKLMGIDLGHDRFYYNDKNIYKSKRDVLVDAVGGAYLLIKRKVFNELGGFDTKYFMYLEDVDLCRRAGFSKHKIIFCPHSKISHIGGASSKNKYHILHQAWYDSRRYYFMKHHGFLVNVIIQPIFFIDEYLFKIRESISQLVQSREL